MLETPLSNTLIILLLHYCSSALEVFQIRLLYLKMYFDKLKLKFFNSGRISTEVSDEGVQGNQGFSFCLLILPFQTNVI